MKKLKTEMLRRNDPVVKSVESVLTLEAGRERPIIRNKSSA